MECSICYSEIKTENLCTTKCCNNKFHFSCLLTWSKSCPICRSNIDEICEISYHEDIEYYIEKLNILCSSDEHREFFNNIINTENSEIFSELCYKFNEKNKMSQILVIILLKIKGIKFF
uniref:RING-type domain-containing protein n=1 Tax=viral metagenome TaxID=1070528 RepID=A0A6C0ADE5_9ZZZZ